MKTIELTTSSVEEFIIKALDNGYAYLDIMEYLDNTHNG